MSDDKRPKLQLELSALLNRYSCENASDSPDFILAGYLIRCLDAFDIATKKRDAFWNFRPGEYVPPPSRDEMRAARSVSEGARDE